MKRREVLKAVREAAEARGLSYETFEGGPHTKVKVGDKKSTISRTTEVDEITVKKFFKQFEEVLGEGWWK